VPRRGKGTIGEREWGREGVKGKWKGSVGEGSIKGGGGVGCSGKVPIVTYLEQMSSMLKICSITSRAGLCLSSHIPRR
jgi:hypothetical protein